MSAEFKPCPFCGSLQVKEVQRFKLPEVTCLCGASNEVGMWNQRADPQARVNALAGLLRRWVAQCDDDGDASRADDETIMIDTKAALQELAR